MMLSSPKTAPGTCQICDGLGGVTIEDDDGDGICDDNEIAGCTDETACLNYDPLANTDNGTCNLPVLGCTDVSAYNYNPNANVSDPSARFLPNYGNSGL